MLSKKLQLCLLILGLLEFGNGRDYDIDEELPFTVEDQKILATIFETVLRKHEINEIKNYGKLLITIK